MSRVYLGLGANIKPRENLRAGVAALRQTFTKVALSPVYESEAVGMDGPDFFNMVAGINCHMPLAGLQAWIHDIETAHGRDRQLDNTSGHGLDIDILLFDVLNQPKENIPRTDIFNRAYVLRPFADLAPHLICPGSNKTLLTLWQTNQLQQKTKLIDIQWGAY